MAKRSRRRRSNTRRKVKKKSQFDKKIMTLNLDDYYLSKDKRIKRKGIEYTVK